VSDTERKLPIRCDAHGMLMSVFRYRPGSESASLGCPRCANENPLLAWQPLNDFGLPVPPTLEELKDAVITTVMAWRNSEGGWADVDVAAGRLTAHPDWKGE
jgi:hypothetical protein